MLDTRQLLIHSLLLTAAIEALTLLLRFGFGMESTRDTASTVGALTGGIRIHHGYIGVLLVIAGAFLRKAQPPWVHWLLAIGIAMIASDLVHHFLVLWSIKGSPEFHLTYPSRD